jgi:hypothetical protein
MASMEAIYNDRVNCYKCLQRNGADPAKDRGRGFKKRKSLGCFDFTTRTYLLDNIKYKSCIGNYTLQGLGYYYELFINYEKGILPFEGSLGKQPNKIMEVIQIIDNTKKEQQKKAN